MPTNVQFTDEELIQKLKTFTEEKGFTPSMNDLRQAQKMPSPYTYKKRFGSWSKALQAAGLRSTYIKRRIGKAWSEDEVLRWVKAFYDREGRPPHRIDYEADVNAPCVATVQKFFGSLNACNEKVGIFTASPLYKNLTLDSYLKHRIMDRRFDPVKRTLLVILRQIGKWLEI